MNTAPEFSYVLMEYSKFEFERGLIPKALRLAEKAVELNPDSYHSWFHLGIFMRKINRLPDAIYNLEKARELNPTHLPIYNELGRAYTFIGEYEKANEKFNEALKEEKYPNYRHKLMTLQFLADNYKRWAEAFGLRHDLSGQLRMLENAHETILKALDINPKDKRLWELCWDIRKNYAIATWRMKGFKEGKPLLEECLKRAQHKGESFSPDDEMIAEASFYLAGLSMKEKEINKKEINGYIDQGLARCAVGSKWFIKFQEIKNQIDGEDTLERKRNIGKIRFFNVKKRYGVIESGERTYLFFEDGIRSDQPVDDVASMAGKTVSFILIENPGHKHRLIAWDVLVQKE